MPPAQLASSDRRAQLIAASESYFNGLRSKDVSGVLWHEDVIARSPITPGYPEPLVGRDVVVDYFRTLLPALGEVEIVQHFIALDESAIATCAMVGVGPVVLRVIDRFTVDAEGRITDQENHYDPRPALP